MPPSFTPVGGSDSPSHESDSGHDEDKKKSMDHIAHRGVSDCDFHLAHRQIRGNEQDGEEIEKTEEYHHAPQIRGLLAKPGSS